MADDRLIPAKANRVLNLILLFLLLIFIRVWFLSVIQHDDLLEESRKPQRRSLVERTERATICDRFNIPLAINKMQYKASIYYADIQQIPSFTWEKERNGNRVKILSRSLYITKLALLLAQELELDPERIEDLIHSKASLFPHTPFVIKENISEEQYYRLKMLEKDWLGICAHQGYKRIYPLGKTASDIIGYLGVINDKEHFAVANEIKTLENYLEKRELGETPLLPKDFNNPIEIRQRLKALKEKSYTINDVVGKAGIESLFEERLRGFYTKKLYEINRKGSILRELPGSRKAVSGQRIWLSLSAELQEFAESLLASHETKSHQNTPWIKGGAIIAMVPKTGELLTLASYPRFDPNDFIDRDPSLIKWLENKSYIGELWDGKRNLEKECFSEVDNLFTTRELPLNWENFLSMILNKNSPIFTKIQKIQTIQEAIHFQQEAQNRETSDDSLLLDLCRLVANEVDFSKELLQSVGQHTLSTHRINCQIAARAQEKISALIKQKFHEIDFKQWRKNEFKSFLQLKRSEEKESKKYPRPYIEYLDMMEQQFFKEFWEKNRLFFLDAYFCRQVRFPLPHLTPYLEALFLSPQKEFLALETLSPSISLQYLQTLHPFSELNFPLHEEYRCLRNYKKKQTGQDLASSFYPISSYGYGRSQAYRQSTPQGSLFKLVVAYEALREQYHKALHLSSINPLTLIDDLQTDILGYHLNGEPITRHYKGGRMPRSSHSHIGKIDLIGALEQSSNIYFSILASDIIENPAYLTQCATQFGFGKKTGIELPGEIRGHLPDDLGHNKSGLYAFAIGQHSLVVTPLQTAVMLSTIANGGDVLKPKIVQMIAGTEPSEQVDLLFDSVDYPFKEDLALVGIHFPIFTEALSNFQQTSITQAKRKIQNQLEFPEVIRKPILEGMRRAVAGSRGTSRPAALRQFFPTSSAFQDYLNVQKDLVGKTGTAEIFYKPTIDAFTSAKIENHVWFGGIAFDRPVDDSFEATPELVVVVYLKFGGGGKEAAPLAAQMVKKWREIQAKHLYHPAKDPELEGKKIQNSD